MKNKFLAVALGLVALITSCSKKDDVASPQTGSLSVTYGVNTGVILKSTKSSVDPQAFKLEILDSKNEVAESFDPISDAPEKIELLTGAYTVKAFSEEFTAPAFAKPVYGAEESVTINANQETKAILNCVQTNAGVKFNWTDEFKDVYSDYSAKISAGEKSLNYPKDESRVGYFLTGDVTIEITTGTGVDVKIYTKTITLNARELVTVKVSPGSVSPTDPESGTLSITITVDDSVTEREETFEIGDDGSGTGTAPLNELTEDFSSGVDKETAAINGWTVVNRDDAADRVWHIKEYQSNKYAHMSGYQGTADEYESWLISPALDLASATYKNLKFETAQHHWGAGTSLEVYVMDGANPNNANKTLLSATLAKESDANYAFIPSGTIDLSSYSGTRYIAFKYVGKGTGFQLDNFHFGFKADGSVDPVDPPTEAEVLSEDFAGVTGGSPVGASNPGWNGNDNFPTTEKAYQAGGSIKLGSSKSDGYITSKALDLSANGGKFTVSFKVKGWKDTDKELIVAVGSEEKTVSFTSTGKEGSLVDASVDFTGGTTNSTVSFKTKSKARFFLDDVKITTTK